MNTAKKALGLSAAIAVFKGEWAILIAILFALILLEAIDQS